MVIDPEMFIQSCVAASPSGPAPSSSSDDPPVDGRARRNRKMGKDDETEKGVETAEAEESTDVPPDIEALLDEEDLNESEHEHERHRKCLIEEATSINHRLLHRGKMNPHCFDCIQAEYIQLKTQPL